MLAQEGTPQRTVWNLRSWSSRAGPTTSDATCDSQPTSTSSMPQLHAPSRASPVFLDATRTDCSRRVSLRRTKRFTCARWIRPGHLGRLRHGGWLRRASVVTRRRGQNSPSTAVTQLRLQVRGFSRIAGMTGARTARPAMVFHCRHHALERGAAGGAGGGCHRRCGS